MKENVTKVIALPFATPFNHNQDVENQADKTSLARRGQSLKPADLVRRLREGGQVPELNVYENYNDSEFSETDFDDCGSLFRIDPLEYVDQARDKMALAAKYGKKKDEKTEGYAHKDQKEKSPSNNPDVGSKDGPVAASD